MAFKVGNWLAEQGITFDGFMNIVGGLVLLVIICSISAIVIYYFSVKKKFNINIVVFENINGVVQRTKSDLATEILLPGRGIKVLMLKTLTTNFENYLPMPRLKMGPNTYWFVIGEDGEWINSQLESVDEKRKLLNLRLDPSDLRTQRAGLQKLLKDDYKKEKWYERYAPYIALAILILFLGVAAWLITDKVLDGIRVGNQNLEISLKVTELQQQVLSSLDKVCSNSGLIQTGT